MVNETLDIVVGSFQFNCKGIESSRGVSGNRVVTSPLRADQSEPVFIKIYQDGRSKPLCKYFHDERCLAGDDPKIQGECLYYSIR